MKKALSLSLLLTLSPLVTYSLKAIEDFSSYTSIKVLRDQRIGTEEKERWVMENILGLDSGEQKENRFLAKKKKKFFKKDLGKRKRQKLLKEWIDSL